MLLDINDIKNTIISGDSIEVIKDIPSESIDCVVTSPPYWGLRDYGVEGQLGLEPTFQEYIENLLQVFDEIHRVLKKTGTVWVNLGDTYNTIPVGNVGTKARVGATKNKNVQEKALKKRVVQKSIQLKSLCMIPSRFAIEMIERGWILRNQIIWHKPNVIPSSVKDRFTVDFEYLFFFSKSKKYYFEQQFERANYDGRKDTYFKGGVKYKGYNHQTMLSRGHERWGRDKNGIPIRNKRAVWKIPTKPFKEAHFAVYPEKLIEIPIKAGCPAGGIVLDPFSGAGTTAVVAKALGRNYIGIELNPEYIEITKRRLKKTGLTLL